MLCALSTSVLIILKLLSCSRLIRTSKKSDFVLNVTFEFFFFFFNFILGFILSPVGVVVFRLFYWFDLYWITKLVLTGLNRV